MKPPSLLKHWKILKFFFTIHDPTQENRQGNDIGTQYRSAIFYHNEQQKEVAEKVRNKISDEHVYPNPIVTEITPFKAFYEAEEYHKNYYNNNKEGGYCRVIIDPKIKKLLREYSGEVKEE